jgi:hypothetical protein
VVRLLVGGDPEAGVQGCRGVAADPHVKLFGFFHPCLGLGAPEAQLVFADRETQGRLLAGGEEGSLKAFQFTNRPGGAARALMDIELDNLASLAAARILHIDGHLERPTRRQRRLTQLKFGEGKLCVAESVAEGIKRRRGDV